MHAVIRRYEGVDQSRRDELVRVLKDEFVPRLSEDADFQAYYVIFEAGVLATVTVCETREAAEESTRLATEFIRERNLTDAVPNPPQVTAGEVTVQKVSAGAMA